MISIKNISWAAAYTLFEITQGFFLHPYQTMRQIVRDRVFAWTIGMPLIFWAVLILVWRIGWSFLFTIIPFSVFWLFLALWISGSILLYQLLLLYLFYRFLRAKVA